MTFFSHLREVFSYYLLKYIFSSPFFLSSCGTPIIWMSVCWCVSYCHRGLWVLKSFHSFFFILFHGSDFHHSVFHVTYCSSASVILVLILSSVFFFSSIVVFISVCFFSSFRSLLNISCIFLISASILFLRYQIIFIISVFHVDCILHLHLVVLLGLYLVRSPRTYSFAVSFCLIFCDRGFCSTGCRVIVLASAVCP